MRRGLVAAAGLVALVGLTASPARAQSSGAAETTRKRPIGMDELTITARKGRLQDLPLAASALPGEALEDLDVRKLRDLRGLAPNLAVAESAGGARVYLRGLGKGDSIASDGPDVGLYLDGVYLTRAEASLFSLPDIDRVEVLRGPQGTQSAKSAIGGAVHVITRRPTLDAFSSRAEVRVGNYDRFDTRLSVNVPLIAERAAARVSFTTATRDGFRTSERTGRVLDDDRLLGLHAQLLAAPSDDLELVLALDGSRDTRSSAPELGVRKERLQGHGASLTARWNLRDTLTVTSISAWRRHDADTATAPPFASLALDGARARGEHDQKSQELQLGGRALDGKLSYVAGVFWLAEQEADGSGREVASNSHAAYGQATYDLTDRLSMTLGARLGAQRKRLERGGIGTATRSSDLSPSATLRYELSDAAHVYGTWSRGSTGAGFDARAQALDGEKLTSHEIGFKSLFLDGHLRLNAAAFYSRYQDIQLGLARRGAAPEGLARASTRAASAEIKGAELELRAVPLPGLELSSALGVTDARYTEIDAPDVSRTTGDLEQRRLTGSPTYTFSLGASYQLPLGALGDLSVRSDWTHIGRSGRDPDPTLLRRGKHGELDAQLAWTLSDGLTEIVLFGSNLLDREYVADGIDLGAGEIVLYNPPRTYGLEIRRSF
jgi:iron complex outermembrane receptor protein